MREDRELLRRFTNDLEHHLLGPLVTTHLSFLRIRAAELVPVVWGEIMDILGSLREWLSATAEDLTDRIDAALMAVGLTGVQLKMKVGAFFEALEKRQGTQRNALVRWYREALAWANVILGSLAKAYPGAEPLKEFKEFLETGLDYTGAAARF